MSEKYVRCVQEMYRDCGTEVRCAAGKTETFKVKVGLHQGSALSPLLFAVVMDVLTDDVRRETPWNMMFADDIVLMNKEKGQAEEELEGWRNALEKRGLKVSRAKTEYLCINKKRDLPPIKIGDDDLPEVQDFKYLGSIIEQSGSCTKEVKKRIQAGWSSWRNTTGILCDKRVPVKVKGKLYKTMVRPAMLYGLETAALTCSLERKMQVAEMRMLRWSLGVTRRDRIRNEGIRGTIGVCDIAGKLRETRLRWYGHVQRREEEHITKRVLNMELPGKRKRGRPKRRWRDCVADDMRKSGLSTENALDRRKWKLSIRCGDP